jgi:alpha-tubulin suppressor-like RCC1 family protein
MIQIYFVGEKTSIFLIFFKIFFFFLKSNSFGQLGDGTNTAKSLPGAVNKSGDLNGKLFLKITAGSRHTCAITNDYLSYCWGLNK